MYVSTSAMMMYLPKPVVRYNLLSLINSMQLRRLRLLLPLQRLYIQLPCSQKPMWLCDPRLMIVVLMPQNLAWVCPEALCLVQTFKSNKMGN